PEVEAFLVIPTNVQLKPFPAVHFIHWLETEAIDSNRSQFLTLSINLAEQGYLSILPTCFWSLDKQKYKENPQLYYEKWWKTEYQNDAELCCRQIEALNLTQEILLSRQDVDKERIGLVAHDFGAMFGSLLPTFGDQFRSFAFMATTGRFSDWFRFGSTLNQNRLSKYVEQMSFVDQITNSDKLSDKPKFLLVGDDDFYVPKEQALEFFNQLPEPKEIGWYHAKHAMNSLAFKDLMKWILKTV
ncbi:MAG: dienelactone hydrolase family protein, partial [Candidatus Heimdallarchaeota archaeon]|nr:dienelactone hydrolase family protein [Candidatus Heimdallarchaeota archaeon]